MIYSLSQKWWLLRTRAQYLSQSLTMQLQLAPVWLTSWQHGSLIARLRHKSDKSCDDQQSARPAVTRLHHALAAKMLFNSETLGLLSQEMGWQFFLHSSLLLLALHKKVNCWFNTAKRTLHHQQARILCLLSHTNLLFFVDRHEVLVIFPAHSFDTLHTALIHTRVDSGLHLPLSPFSLPTVYGQISSSLMILRHLSNVRPNTVLTQSVKKICAKMN